MAAATAAGPPTPPAVNVVIGAGGPTGLQCVARLLQTQRGGVVRAVVRDPARHEDALKALQQQQQQAEEPQHPRPCLQVVAGDVTDPPSLKAALTGASGVIFAASGRGFWSAAAVDHQGVANVAAAAAASAAGASGDGGDGGGGGAAPSPPHVVLVSSMLTHPSNRFNPVRLLLNNIRWSLMDSKYAGEQALRRSGVPYAVVRPGGLSNAPGGRARLCMEADATKERVDVTGPIARADVAAVCAACLTHPAARNRTLSVWAERPAAPLPSEGAAALGEEVARLLAALPPAPAAAAVAS